jgi:hypothetical protein
MTSTPAQLLRSIRLWLTLFIAGLILSGLTAFPLQSELTLLVHLSSSFNLPNHAPSLARWLVTVHNALVDENSHYPFLAYGTDWLAFGHLVIATVFVLPFLNPVHNRDIITFGLIACAGVLPLALIAGPIRGIPPFWRLIDCSFGVLGAIPLLIVRSHIRTLEQTSHSDKNS